MGYKLNREIKVEQAALYSRSELELMFAVITLIQQKMNGIER